MEKLYTVEEIAEMTSLTTRTIRNYLKDGILKGRKIGGQWRFTEEDVKNFMDSGNIAIEVIDFNKQSITDFLDGVYTDIAGKIQICSIIDVYYESHEEYEVMMEKRDTFMEDISSRSEKEKQFMKVTWNMNQEECKGRYILFGSPEFIVNSINFLQE